MAGSFHHIFHLRGSSTVLSWEVSALITSVGTLTYYFALFSSYYLSLIKILFVYLGVLSAHRNESSKRVGSMSLSLAAL